MIEGEFNGWKPEDLTYDDAGVASIVKRLGPGRYRYCYKVDDVETIDPHSSIIHDNNIASNVILVLNPPMQQRFISNEILNKEQQSSGTSIRQLNLRNYSLGDDGVSAVTQIIQRSHASIECLDASHNAITDKGLNSIIAAIQLLHLKELKLNGNSFSANSIRKLCEGISLSKTLVHLELSGCHFYDEGALVIGTYLGYNGSIQSLHISDCNISSEGVTAIGRGLEGNKHLQILHLSHNQVTEPGIKALASSLEINASLKSLYLSNNPLGPMGTMWIGKMLNINHTLTTIDLSHCQVMKDGAVVGLYAILSAILEKNKILSHIYLRNNEIDNTAIVWIAHCLSKCRTVLTFDLDGNQLNEIWFLPNHFITNLGMCNHYLFLYITHCHASLFNRV